MFRGSYYQECAEIYRKRKAYRACQQAYSDAPKPKFRQRLGFWVCQWWADGDQFEGCGRDLASAYSNLTRKVTPWAREFLVSKIKI